MPDRVLYDAECRFCRWALAWILRWDRKRRLRPVALQDTEAVELLPGMEEDERLESWHLVSADGSVRSAGAAAAPMLRLLPGGRPFAALAERAPRLTDTVYRWVADHRSTLARPLNERALARADRVIAARQ